MTYVTLRDQIASRIDGIEDPSLAQRLGYTSPLMSPWTPAHVGEQIFDARGSSYGTSDNHPLDPTRFQRAAYTLLDPVPAPVGTTGPDGIVKYETHNSRLVVAGGYGAEVTPYGISQGRLADFYNLPQNPSIILGDDFGIFDGGSARPSVVYEIGDRALSDLIILDERPEVDFFRLMRDGQIDEISFSHVHFKFVCTVYNVSGTKGAIYFTENGRVWCYTTDDCTLGLVRLPNGSVFTIDPYANTAEAHMLYHARATLDDDRFDKGQLSLVTSDRRPATRGANIHHFNGFRQIETQVISPIGSHLMTSLTYNDYHVLRTTHQSRDTFVLDVKSPNHASALYKWKPGDLGDQHTPTGPIDMPPSTSLAEFRQVSQMVGWSWTRHGWAAHYTLPQGGTGSYKYI